LNLIHIRFNKARLSGQYGDHYTVALTPYLDGASGATLGVKPWSILALDM